MDVNVKTSDCGMTTFSSRLSKMLVAVISGMKNSLEWTSQKVWVWGLLAGFLFSFFFVLFSFGYFGFLQCFANQSSRDRASSIVRELCNYFLRQAHEKIRLFDIICCLGAELETIPFLPSSSCWSRAPPAGPRVPCTGCSRCLWLWVSSYWMENAMALWWSSSS